MSDTLYLACLTCRVKLWVGQGGYSAPAKAYMYGGEEHRAAFEAFYDRHMGHDIRLTNLEGLYALADEWREFDDDEIHGRPREGRGYLGLAQMRLRHDTSVIPESWGRMKP